MMPELATRTKTLILRASGIPLGPNARVHWRVRSKVNGALRDEVAWQARDFAARYGTFKHANVRIVLVRIRGREMDPDNAIACCKTLIDGLVRGGLLVDDRRENITLTVDQEQAAKGGSRGARLEVAVEV